MGVTNGAEHWQLEGDHRCQQLLDGRGITHADILGRQQPPTEHIPHEVHGFVALVGLDAIDRDDQATVGADLVVPGRVGGEVLRGPEQGAVGVKQGEHLAPGDGQVEGRESCLDRLVRLVERVLLGQPELADPDDTIQAKGEARQGQGVGSRTAIRAAVGGAG